MSLIACLFQFHEQDTDSIYSPLPIQPKWLGQGYVLITVWTEVKHHLVYTYFIYNSHTREHTPTLLQYCGSQDHSLQYCMHRITVCSIACTGSQFAVLDHSLQYWITVCSIACTGSQFAVLDHSLQYCMHRITVCSIACRGSQLLLHAQDHSLQYCMQRITVLLHAEDHSNIVTPCCR